MRTGKRVRENAMISDRATPSCSMLALMPFLTPGFSGRYLEFALGLYHTALK